jgi:hypothetical protein
MASVAAMEKQKEIERKMKETQYAYWIWVVAATRLLLF